MSDLQIFQMKNVVWKQNKCLLGHDVSVMRTYQIRKKKPDEKASCACKRNEFVISWTVHLPLASWWDGESSEVPRLFQSSHVPCATTMFVASSLFLQLIYKTWAWDSRKKKLLNGRGTVR